MTLANPRTWEILSNDINNFGDTWAEDPVSKKQAVATVGQVGNDFFRFCKNLKFGATIQKIIKGDYVAVPASTDMLFSLVYASVAWINNNWSIQTTKAFSDELIRGTNNLYRWFNQDGIDISIAFLLNKCQTIATKTILRPALMSNKDLEPAYKAYEKIAESYAKTTR